MDNLDGLLKEIQEEEKIAYKNFMNKKLEENEYKKYPSNGCSNQ